MDSWFIFQRHLVIVITDGGTEKGRSTGRSDVPGASRRELW